VDDAGGHALLQLYNAFRNITRSATTAFDNKRQNRKARFGSVLPTPYVLQLEAAARRSENCAHKKRYTSS
jgi:hypothetical protein